LLTFTRTQGESNTTFAEQMNSIQLSFLTELVQYGPSSLDKNEYEDRMRVRLREYYQVLAEGLLQLRGKNYFEFHKNWLRNLEMPLSWSRLLRGFCMAAWNGISHPVAAVRSLARWWGKATASKKTNTGART
jgi:hypothetical protein